MKIFVHLARDKDVETWRQAWRAGTLVGVNDETPYGYGRAERMGCELRFSRSDPESFAAKLLRLAVRAVAGFDYLHARRQFKEMVESDVIWTHTESQYLAVAALAFQGKRPKLIGQSIWLFDRWRSLTPLHKLLYRRLIRNVDVLTFHSSENLAAARRLFPGRAALLVPFGIPSETTSPPRAPATGPLRILAPGSDRHRDWTTLVEAVDGMAGASLLILSGVAPRRLARGRPNVLIEKARSNAELNAHFAGASVVCVPLKPNLHASGVTVIQEAVLAGVPVVATGTGGLEDYFGPDAVLYVPANNPAALRQALNDVARNPEAALTRAARAQASMAADAIGAEAYVRRHVEISRELMLS